MKTPYIIYILFLVIVSLIVGYNFLILQPDNTLEYASILGIYGTVMVIYLITKLVMSFKYSPVGGVLNSPYLVSVVIPLYNENVDDIKETLNSLLIQSYKVTEIFLIDDGSENLDTYKYLRTFIESYNKKNLSNSNLDNTKIKLHYSSKNLGKRHAQSWAFNQVVGDIIITLDSDVVLTEHAIHELLLPFNDSKVMGVTGHISARNKNDNILTKLIDLRYNNAFRVERAAQSVTNSVICLSGALSAYRKEVILNNLDDYLNQKFLGKSVQFGDDRRLSNYALREGKTVYQSTALAYTLVPTSLGKFIKQQCRWAKSFYRESYESIKMAIIYKKPRVAIWAFSEILLQLLFTFSLVAGVILKSIFFGQILIAYYIGYIALSSYARNVYYVQNSPFVYLMSPLYGFLHIMILLPIRYYALFTIRKTDWGTR